VIWAQIARGLTLPELVSVVGISVEAFSALFGADSPRKDPSKLISAMTYSRLAATIGLNSDTSGFRCGAVNEWRFQKGNAVAWKNAVSELRKALISHDIEMACIRKRVGFFSREEFIVLIHDGENNLRFAVTRATKDVVRFLKGTFDADIHRETVVSPVDFEMTTNLIANNVYRVTQFAVALGGDLARYSWADVQAAAKEFNFTPDALIELMVERVQKGISSAQPSSAAEPVPQAVRLQAAA